MQDGMHDGQLSVGVNNNIQLGRNEYIYLPSLFAQVKNLLININCSILAEKLKQWVMNRFISHIIIST